VYHNFLNNEVYSYQVSIFQAIRFVFDGVLNAEILVQDTNASIYTWGKSCLFVYEISM